MTTSTMMLLARKEKMTQNVIKGPYKSCEGRYMTSWFIKSWEGWQRWMEENHSLSIPMQEPRTIKRSAAKIPRTKGWLWNKKIQAGTVCVQGRRCCKYVARGCGTRFIFALNIWMVTAGFWVFFSLNRKSQKDRSGFHLASQKQQ